MIGYPDRLAIPSDTATSPRPFPHQPDLCSSHFAWLGAVAVVHVGDACTGAVPATLNLAVAAAITRKTIYPLPRTTTPSTNTIPTTTAHCFHCLLHSLRPHLRWYVVLIPPLHLLAHRWILPHEVVQVLGCHLISFFSC